MRTPAEISKQRDLAYRLWEERGKPEGRPEDDWFEAEKRLFSDRHETESAAVDEASLESFPASDPPSTHLPDRPPVNKRRKLAQPRRPS